MHITFSDDALDTIAKYATEVNTKSENIGARRLHTIMEKLLEDVLYEAPEIEAKSIHYTSETVQARLANLVKDASRNNIVL